MQQPQNEQDLSLKGFGRSMGKAALDGLKDSLKLMLFGGTIGAVALGTIGFFMLGWEAALIGAAAGFVIGAVGVLFLY